MSPKHDPTTEARTGPPVEGPPIAMTCGNCGRTGPGSHTGRAEFCQPAVRLAAIHGVLVLVVLVGLAFGVL